MTILGRAVTDPFSEAQISLIEIRNGRITAITPVHHKNPAQLPFVFPGFIDAHTHPFETGLELIFPNLRPAASIADVLELIREGQQLGRDCGVLVGLNLEPGQLAEHRLPTTSELDLVTGRIPTIVYRVDGHSAVLNSAGIQLLPTEHISANRTRDGVVRGILFEAASRLFKLRLLRTVLKDALGQVSNLALSRGVTTIGALVGWPELKRPEWRLFVDSLAALRVRSVPYLQTWDAVTAVEFGLKQVGGCLLIDGSFGSHTAALNEPYSDTGEMGICYQTDRQITEFLATASSLGLQTAVHSIGDRAVEQVLRCHGQAGTDSFPLRHRIEHAELVPDRLFEDIKRFGITLCVQPTFETTWGGPAGMYARRLGSRWSLTNRLKDLMQYRIPLCGGSDSPITSLDAIAGIRAASNMPNADQRLDPASATALFTTWAATALGLPESIGKISCGLSADLTLLDGDPRFSDSVRIIATIRDGEVVHGTAEPALLSCSCSRQNTNLNCTSG
ncbi:MAG: amidohydrolase family protein [candidate division WOR-3 bacterium]